MLLAHLSDLHLRAALGPDGPRRRLVAAFDRILALSPRPDALLVTGDLTESAEAEAYEALGRHLAELGLPAYLVMGNHDRRAPMIATLNVAHMPGDTPFIQYAVEHLGVRLLVLDTTSPDHPHGAFCRARLDWLSERLAEAPGRPTLVAMHHPPVSTGIAIMDGPGAAWAGDLVRRLRGANIVRILCGHVHRSVQTSVGNVPVTVCPSLVPAIALDLGPPSAARSSTDKHIFEDEPGALHLHRWAQGRLVTHTLFVDRYLPMMSLTEPARC